jgi:hypothetical protein
MTDPMIVTAVATSLLATVAIAAVTLLKGWREWIELKRMELSGPRADATMPLAGSRIELADLRERVRKLEEIAAGIDL